MSFIANPPRLPEQLFDFTESDKTVNTSISVLRVIPANADLATRTLRAGETVNAGAAAGNVNLPLVLPLAPADGTLITVARPSGISGVIFIVATSPDTCNANTVSALLTLFSYSATNHQWSWRAYDANGVELALAAQSTANTARQTANLALSEPLVKIFTVDPSSYPQAQPAPGDSLTLKWNGGIQKSLVFAPTDSTAFAIAISNYYNGVGLYPIAFGSFSSPAYLVVEFSGVPNDGETFVVVYTGGDGNGVEAGITAKTTPSAAYEFAIDSDFTIMAANFAAAINSYAGYGVSALGSTVTFSGPFSDSYYYVNAGTLTGLNYINYDVVYSETHNLEDLCTTIDDNQIPLDIGLGIDFGPLRARMDHGVLLLWSTISVPDSEFIVLGYNTSTYNTGGAIGIQNLREIPDQGTGLNSRAEPGSAAYGPYSHADSGGKATLPYQSARAGLPGTAYGDCAVMLQNSSYGASQVMLLMGDFTLHAYPYFSYYSVIEADIIVTGVANDVTPRQIGRVRRRYLLGIQGTSAVLLSAGSVNADGFDQLPSGWSITINPVGSGLTINAHGNTNSSSVRWSAMVRTVEM